MPVHETHWAALPGIRQRLSHRATIALGRKLRSSDRYRMADGRVKVSTRDSVWSVSSLWAWRGARRAGGKSLSLKFEHDGFQRRLQSK